MDGIDRRLLMKGTALAGLAFSIPGTQSALTVRYSHAQEVSRGRAWPNRALRDRLKLAHPLIQAPMGGAVGPEMVVAVSQDRSHAEKGIALIDQVEHCSDGSQ
jgi:hypothetical protein